MSATLPILLERTSDEVGVFAFRGAKCYHASMDMRMRNFTTSDEGFQYATSEECVAEIDRILNEMRRKSGVSALSDSPNVVSEPSCEGESPFNEGDVGGGYDPLRNRIRLDPTENFGNGFELLLTFVHERVHARWFNTFRTVAQHKRRTGEILEPDSIRLGFEDYVTKEFRGFNEWVTELIAEEAYLELIKRQGEAKFLSGRIENGKRWYAGYEYHVYEEEKRQVREAIARLSESCQVPASVVWNAIKRGYFEGADIGGILAELDA